MSHTVIVLAVVFLIALLVAGGIILSGTLARTDVAVHQRLPVFYAGEQGALQRALVLSPYLTIAPTVDEARTLVINNVPLTDAEVEAIHEAVRMGAGLILIMGDRIPAALSRAILSQPPGPDQKDPVSLAVRARPDDPLTRAVTWNSAPQVRERTRLPPVGEVIATAFETGEPLLLVQRLGNGTAYVFGPWLSGQANAAFTEWPYFTYLVYHLAMRAAGKTPVGYADYPLSPVPHERERQIIVVLVTFMVIGTVALFLLVRHYSLRHPEELERIVANAELYRRGIQAEESTWEEIGFQRPLAGFLVLFAVGLLLFIPLMVYQTIIIPRVLLPSAQALGAWGWVVNFFQTFWLLFDMGTSLALVKYLSELRVDRPAEGVKYVQLFVWWQAITGTIQVAMVAILCATIIPQTAYGYMTWYFVIHALIQFPGFLRVFQFMLRALQRTDADQVLNILATPAPGTMGILVIFAQSLVVVLMTRWAAGQPALGPSMGGAIGMGLGLYVTEIGFFLVSLWIVLRLGYAARVAFLAHFDRDTLIRALAFGAPVTVAGVMGALGWSVQLWLLEHYLVNYTEALANWNIAYGLIIAYGTLGALYGAVMPATSEGFSHQRLELTRYYIAQSFKYGGWFSAFVASAFLAMADRFILGSLGSEWARAAHLVSILTIWGAVQYPAWIADNLQQGVGKPYLQALLLIMEQSIRIIMMFIFLERFQLTGMVLAYLIALPTKDVVAWIVNWKVITPFRIYWWQSVVAPLLAGAVTYAMVRVVGGIIWRADLVTSLLVFFIGTIPSVPWFSFWSGVFGGWDDATLDELRRAALMTPFEGMAVGLARFLHRPRPGTLERVLINPAYLIYWACALGARWSPLHNRFPLHRAAAIREAQSLTLEKVALA